MTNVLHILLPRTDPRLGRNILHDPESLRYLAPEAAPQSVAWERHIPILDQGQVGSCTGNAEVGALGTGPLVQALADQLSKGLVLDERLALSIYSDAETLDGNGPYPPNDHGSNGLSVAKVAKARGYISGYVHATSLDQAHGALASGPVMFGTNWYSDMFNPTSEGIVKPTGSVAGGHEYLCREYDAVRDLWWCDNSWSTSWGVQGRFAFDSHTLGTLLGQHGDVTALLPLTAPAPTPTPAATTRTFTPADAELLDGWSVTRHVGCNRQAADAWKRGQS